MTKNENETRSKEPADCERQIRAIRQQGLIEGYSKCENELKEYYFMKHVIDFLV